MLFTSKIEKPVRRLSRRARDRPIAAIYPLRNEVGHFLRAHVTYTTRPGRITPWLCHVAVQSFCGIGTFSARGRRPAVHNISKMSPRTIPIPHLPQNFLNIQYRNIDFRKHASQYYLSDISLCSYNKALHTRNQTKKEEIESSQFQEYWS